MTLSILSSSEAQPVPVDPSLPPYRPGVQVAGTLDGLCGMDTVQAMMKAWNEAFQKYHPGANVTVESKDPLGPEERIALGPHTAELFNPDYQAYEDAYGYEPFRVKFCMGAHILKSHVSAIGVYVNKENPLSQIALDKLDAIYSEERRRGYSSDITTWGQLGLAGEWADKPIRIYGFYWRDDVTAYFRKLVMHDAPFKDTYQVPGGNMSRRTPVVAKDIMTAMASDPYGISFGNASYKTDAVKPIALVDEHGVVGQFTINDLASGRYPLQRYLYFYVNRKPGQPLDPLVKEFLTFVLSKEGQEMVEKDHYLPLTAAMVAAERVKLN